MLSALLLLVLQDVPTLSVEGTRDRTGEGVAFLELSTPRTEVWVDEPVVLTLRFGLSEEFLGSGVIQLFRRPLDLPVQVQAEWLNELPGALLLPPEEAAGTTSFALNAQVVDAGPPTTLVHEAHSYRTLELRRTLVPTAAGELTVPASRLRFAYATRFREDFVNGRVPEDRLDAYVLSRPLTLSVRELPVEGQPPEFRGAIGDYTFAAEAAPRDLVVGERLRLTLTIAGKGNLARLATPPLDDLRDLNLLGTEDEIDGDRRTVTYEFEARATRLEAVPALAFAFFEPESAAYRLVRTQPIPIRVRPDPADVTRPAAAPVADGGSRLWVLAALPGALLALLVLWRLRARAALRRHGAHVRHARDAFRARALEEDVADSLAAFLAAVLECSVAAVVGHDLEQRLRATGIAPEPARRAADLLERLLAPRYGGPPIEGGAQEASALVEELAP